MYNIKSHHDPTEAEFRTVVAERDAMRKRALAAEAVLPDLLAALRRIAEWNDFPSTGRYHGDGTPMSFQYCYGSNGERDYMREIARSAIAKAEGGAS